MAITAYKGFSDYKSTLFLTDPFHAVSEYGSFGKGLYFGDYNCAKSYADSPAGAVFEAQVSADKLLVVHTNYDLAEKYDIDTYAIPLIMALFELPEAEAADYFIRHNVEGFYLGDDIYLAARAKGYEAIHVIYNENPDTFELIALTPNCVTNVRHCNGVQSCQLMYG